MKRFIEGEDRRQATLLPDCLEAYVSDDNPVRVIEVFIDELDLGVLGFDGVRPEATGRPAYHPATLLKIYLYGYLNRIPSSRRLERETQRNIELMWLTGRLMIAQAPAFKKPSHALPLGRGLGMPKLSASRLAHARSTKNSASSPAHSEALAFQ
jgi:transposase